MGGPMLVNVGNYKFTGKRLGKGNFAVVDEALHKILNVKVAIKIMDVSEIKEDYVVRNLYREAKIMSKLSHPCISTLFQTMQHGNTYYLVSELVGGGDLCNFIRTQKTGRLDESTTKLFGRQLISAISHMHNLGIVHRDLKMENIILCGTNDRIKIVDFGLSNMYTGDKLLHTHCGSPEYAAPELFVEGKQYGPEVDLWSLGVILYGMVVGHLPFNSAVREGTAVTQRRKKLLEQINKGLSSSHRKALALLSTEFKSMISKLLITDSTKRINITELIFHPWVTERGRKRVRTNPLKKLEEQDKFNILKHVSELIKSNWEDVQHSVRVDPQGNIAGMYNMLVHRKMMSNMNNELIITSTSTLGYCTPRTHVKLPLNNNIEETTPAKNSLTKSPITKQFDMKYASPNKSSLADKLAQAGDAKRVEQKSSSAKTFTVSKPISDGAVLRRIPIITRAMTAGYDHKDQKSRKDSGVDDSQCSCSSGRITPIQIHLDAKPNSLTQARRLIGTPSRLKKIGDARPPNVLRRDEINKTFLRQEVMNHFTNKKSKLEAMHHPPLLPPINIQKSSQRTLSATIPKGSEIPQSLFTKGSQTCRVITMAQQPTGNIRAMKRKSLLPVLQTKQPITPVTASGVRKSAPPNNRPAPTISLMDDAKRHNSAAINHRLSLSNEPIARSIAGYVTKNMGKNKRIPVREITSTRTFTC